MTETMAAINSVARERQVLFRMAANGHRGDPAVLARIRRADERLEKLWRRHRLESAGRRHPIDLLIDRAYEAAYGPGFEDPISLE